VVPLLRLNDALESVSEQSTLAAMVDKYHTGISTSVSANAAGLCVSTKRMRTCAYALLAWRLFKVHRGT